MSDSHPVRHVTLGLSSKLHIFKVFDLLTENDKQSAIKESSTKPNLKTNNFETSEYLKSISIKPKESKDAEKSNSLVNSETGDDIKKTTKKVKPKKLLVLTDTLKEKNNIVKYLACAPAVTSSKSKIQSISSWISKRKFIYSEKCRNCDVSEPKKVKLEWKIEAEIIYVPPDTFYKSTNNLTIGTKNIISYIYTQGLSEIEISIQHVKNITVYKQQSFIKFVMKSSILNDLKHLPDSGKDNSHSPLKLHLKRGSNLKDALIVFTKNPIMQNDYLVLKSIFGADKVIYNSNDEEAKDHLINIFFTVPKLKDNILMNPRVTWDTISKFLSQPTMESSHVMRTSFLTPIATQNQMNKSPISANKSSIGFNKSPYPINNFPFAVNKPPFPVNNSPILFNNASFSVNNSSLSFNNNQISVNNPQLPVNNPSLPANNSAFAGNQSQFTGNHSNNSPTTINNNGNNSNSNNNNNNSITFNKSSKSTVKLVNPPMNQMQNLMLHQSQQQPGGTVNPCTNPVMNTVLCSTPTFIANYAVIATPVTNSRLDPYPNLFNRMINDSQSMRQLAVQVNNIPLAVSNPNNISISLNPGQNNTGLQISDLGALFQHQNQLNGLSNGSISNVNNVNNSNMENNGCNIDESLLHKPLQYIPGRDTGNVFKSYNYAPSPEYSVLMHGTDLASLNYGEYLNDNIINFYLNYIRYEKITDEQRQRSHIFNVFFYTKLQRKSGPHDTPEMRHAEVAKWTKKVDIFDKDFIIIPINENSHWFLAIICFPWMAGMISYDALFGLQHGQILEIPENKSEFATKIRVERLKRLKTLHKIDPKPCILLFDSLQHVSRAPNVKLIREYLKTEWDAKRAAKDGPLVFDKNTIRGFNPQVPQQTNTIDCGIYVLHYVDKFFEEPLAVFTKEYFQNSLVEWFPKETVETKRELIQKLILLKGESQLHLESTRGNSESLLSPKPGLDDSGPDIQIL